MVLALKVAWQLMSLKMLCLAALTPMTMLLNRASADLTIHLGGGSHKKQSKAEEQPQIKQLSATPSHRDVRVHDCTNPTGFLGLFCTRR